MNILPTHIISDSDRLLICQGLLVLMFGFFLLAFVDFIQEKVNPKQAKDLTYKKKLILKNELIKFFDAKIKQGQELYDNRKLVDKLTVASDFETWTKPDEFDKRYRKWGDDIKQIFNNVYKNEQENRFTNPREAFLNSMNQSEIQKWLEGPYRPFLLDDIKSLEEEKNRVRSHMLNENFSPEAFKEYL